MLRYCTGLARLPQAPLLHTYMGSPCVPTALASQLPMHRTAKKGRRCIDKRTYGRHRGSCDGIDGVESRLRCIIRRMKPDSTARLHRLTCSSCPRLRQRANKRIGVISDHVGGQPAWREAETFQTTMCLRNIQPVTPTKGFYDYDFAGSRTPPLL